MKLFLKNGKWWVDFTVDGKRHRQSTGTGNRKIAEAWMDNINVARKMPTFESAVEVLRMLYNKPAQGVLPLDGLWDTYIRLARATGKDKIEPRTLKSRRNQIERLIKWIREKRPTIKTIENVTGPIAAGFAEHLAELGLKTKTRANVIGELNTTWKMLEKASTGVRNPWGSLMPRDTDGKRGNAFSPDQERSVFAAAEKVGKDWWPICKLMRITGLRYGDVARLTWSEISDDAIRLKPNKTKRHKIDVVIPIIEPIRAVLARIEHRGTYLFPLHAELYGNRGRAAREVLNFREVLNAARITGEGYTIHSWRHTAATRLAEAGADIETRKRILGHTNDDTARRYDHDAHLAETKAALEAAEKV